MMAFIERKFFYDKSINFSVYECSWPILLARSGDDMK
jgi:hypothetical protein